MAEETLQIPDSLRVNGEITLQAAGEGPRRAKIKAYSGGLMRFPQIPVPVVLNVAGGRPVTESVPVLTDHEGTIEASVGHTESIVIDGSIDVEALFSGANEATREVIAKLEGGMPLQASVGIRYRESAMQPVAEGERVEVNGRTFEGPLLVINEFLLDEISVVPLGADRNTSVSLAASAFTKQEGATSVAEEVKSPSEPTPGADIEKTLKAAGDTAVAEFRRRQAAEVERCDEIERLCASHGNPTITVTVDGQEKEVSLKAHAIAEGWDRDKTDLYGLRAKRPTAPAAHVVSHQTNEKVLECALSRSIDTPQSVLEKRYDEKTLEAAYNRRFNGMGSQQLMYETLLANGYTGPALRGDALIQAYKEHSLKAAGFSTVSLPNLLGNVANQELLRAFELAPTAYSQLTLNKTRSDFHDRNEVMMTSAVKLTDIGKDGEIKTGKLKERTYSSTLKTCAAMITLTRKDVINDTLGGFDDLPRQLGRQGAIKRDQEFHTYLESTSTAFYAAAKNSLKTSNAFSLAGLEAAILMWRNKVDDAGDKISIPARYIIVPPPLEFEVLKLLRSGQFNETTTADTPQGSSNPYANRFEIVVDDRLSSATTWWLMADPQDTSSFLNIIGPSGEVPVVEQVDTPSDVLGYSWRAYMDYGAAHHMYEGVLKCTA